MTWEVGGRLRREGAYVYLWLIHVDVWQKPAQYCKTIILQLKQILSCLKSLSLRSLVTAAQENNTGTNTRAGPTKASQPPLRLCWSCSSAPGPRPCSHLLCKLWPFIFSPDYTCLIWLPAPITNRDGLPSQSVSSWRTESKDICSAEKGQLC